MHKIDLAKIFFVEEEKRDAETESFLSVAVSRASLLAISRRRSLSLSLRCLDLDFSRPEPEESDPTKDIERDRRRDPQTRRKEVSNRINCCMTEVPRQDSTIKKSMKQFHNNMYFISAAVWDFCWRQLSRSPRIRLEVEFGAYLAS
jgi:hypothetical protein